MIEITRKIEFDAGHRVPSHTGKCRNLHGHRYVLEATFTGPLIDDSANSADGMVADFSDIKKLLVQEIADVWDHALLLGTADDALAAAIDDVLDTRIITIHEGPPTVEVLVRVAARMITDALPTEPGDEDGDYAQLAGVRLERLRLYETPNCWADWRRDAEPR